MQWRFADRVEAGQILAVRLEEHAHREDVIVLGLARGGVPVAAEVAEHLDLALDTFVVRLLRVPGHEDRVLGAATTGGVRIVDYSQVHRADMSQAALDRAMEEAELDVARHELLYREDAPDIALRGRTAIVIDDGIPSAVRCRAAAEAIRRGGPRRIIVAAPVGRREACEDVEAAADELVCLMTPEPFLGVGAWYLEYDPVDDETVCHLLQRARRRSA